MHSSLYDRGCRFNVDVGVFTGVSDVERGSVSKILDAVKAHANVLETFREDHSGKSAAIEDRAQETFEQRYMVR